MRLAGYFISTLTAVPATSLLVVLVIGTITTTACGGDGTPTGPELCSLVSFSRSGDFGVQYTCSGAYTATISSIQYDPFGRRTSYNFALGCDGGSTLYTGSVTNIQWNNIGEAQSATVRINGETCSVSA